jgi:hypothetical protein
MKVNTSNDSYSVRVGSSANINSTLAGTIAPRKFIQLTDVNMIDVKNGDLVTYDEITKTFIPRSSLSINFPDEANIIYVAKNGNDNNSGKAIQEAKYTIESAIGIATAGTVIKVAPGTYVLNNPITIPDQVSIIGGSIREVSIGCSNPGDLFYVGNGNYIAEMSFTGPANSGAIFSFDPNQIRYINQSPYIQNCTNFIPNSTGLRIDGKNAIGPIKSMVLDSYTQYNQGGIGVSITNEGYAQLVSLFTICNDVAVYCGSGGACDLTNSNSSFGNYALVADGLSPLKYTGIITETSEINSDTFTISFNNPEFEILNATYNNVTGILTAYTTENHNFSVGMGVSLSGLGFTCTYESGIIYYPSGQKGYVFEVQSIPTSNSFSLNVGISTLPHRYNSGGTVKLNVIRPYDGQVLYFNTVYSTVNKVQVSSGGTGYTSTPYVTIDAPTTSWGIPAQAVAIVRNGSVVELELVSSGRGYTGVPTITISAPNIGINTAVASLEVSPTYYPIQSSTPVSSGISTITLNDNVPYSVGVGTEVYFYKQSRILASGHSLEYIGSGIEIATALPSSGGVAIQENETDSRNGGLVVYTSTDQSGNFRIGDGVIINQQTGNISGRSYSKSLFSTMTPYILALGGDY